MTAHAKIHVGCKQLGIDEEDRRDLYERVTNKRSLTDMSPAEQAQVVDELKRLGFKPTSKASRKGVIEALKAWMAREAGVDWTVNDRMDVAETRSGFKIAMAQYHKVYEGHSMNSFQDFIAHVRQYSGKQDVYLFQERDWIPVMNALGRQIRAAK